MSARRIVAGFIPLLDCAALVAAAECGFAAQEGLDLRLVRETSWANIRDRLTVGQFDAAHMLGPMVVAASLGIGRLRVPMVAGAALGQGGNAIAVSNASVCADAGGAAGEAGLDPAAQGAALRRVLQRARAARRTAAGARHGLSVFLSQLRSALLAGRVRHRSGPGSAAWWCCRRHCWSMRCARADRRLLRRRAMEQRRGVGGRRPRDHDRGPHLAAAAGESAGHAPRLDRAATRDRAVAGARSAARLPVVR